MTIMIIAFILQDNIKKSYQFFRSMQSYQLLLNQILRLKRTDYLKKWQFIRGQFFYFVFKQISNSDISTQLIQINEQAHVKTI
ncbi:unnamed protein product [Paramecium sonneborni]|uniref:Uncharacterized protein n=1 Tax=Paramecium sonneborni TaxID=65129 RepID=A0A8S1M779_9CILI|nr:unnamed protein product [Paramecium sonneborni]